MFYILVIILIIGIVMMLSNNSGGDKIERIQNKHNPDMSGVGRR